MTGTGDRASPAETTDRNPIREQHPFQGMVIGNYRLVQPLGRGGMGLVWLADQARPVRRQVAIKFIRWADAPPTLRARFEAEGQALALMDHPGGSPAAAGRSRWLAVGLRTAAG